MAYSREVYSAARDRLDAYRKAAEEECEKRRAALYAQIPRLKEIERELAQTGISAARAALSHRGDMHELIERQKKRNLSLQAERAELLTANRLPPDALVPHYHCRRCRDTGVYDGRTCECFKTMLREEACRFANAGSPLPLTTFDSFRLDYYPEEPVPYAEVPSAEASSVEPHGAETGDFRARNAEGRGREPGAVRATARQAMASVLAHCRAYAAHIDKTRENLLLAGPTGLGKTHLALAIANEAIKKGMGVIYDMAPNIFMKFESEYFGHREKTYTRSVLDCDLLVLDDLGSEFTSPFTVTVLYNIVNTRILAGRPMVVSTNLPMSELTPRYNERIVSRLIGDFTLLPFFGRDIRQLRLSEGRRVQR